MPDLTQTNYSKKYAYTLNHPVAVADTVARVGGVADLVTLQAALLHDTLEDTETTAEELSAEFGDMVCRVVMELSDDKSLPKQRRKELQIEHAPQMSAAAKQIKIADMICNVGDLTDSQPVGWPLDRKLQYLEWAAKVVAGCAGSNTGLSDEFRAVLKEKAAQLAQCDSGNDPGTLVSLHKLAHSPKTA